MHSAEETKAQSGCCGVSVGLSLFLFVPCFLLPQSFSSVSMLLSVQALHGVRCTSGDAAVSV